MVKLATAADNRARTVVSPSEQILLRAALVANWYDTREPPRHATILPVCHTLPHASLGPGGNFNRREESVRGSDSEHSEDCGVRNCGVSGWPTADIRRTAPARTRSGSAAPCSRETARRTERLCNATRAIATANSRSQIPLYIPTPSALHLTSSQK